MADLIELAKLSEEQIELLLAAFGNRGYLKLVRTDQDDIVTAGDREFKFSDRSKQQRYVDALMMLPPLGYLRTDEQVEFRLTRQGEDAAQQLAKPATQKYLARLKVERRATQDFLDLYLEHGHGWRASLFDQARRLDCPAGELRAIWSSLEANRAIRVVARHLGADWLGYMTEERAKALRLGTPSSREVLAAGDVTINTLTIGGDMIGASVVQAGSIEQGVQAPELIALLAEVRKAFQASSLPAPESSEAESTIDQLREELERENPRPPRLARLLSGLWTVAQVAAAAKTLDPHLYEHLSALAIGVLHFIQHLPA
jgi:hypothetical protein